MIQLDERTETVTGGSCHRYHFCGDKSFVCRHKSFVMTNICCDKYIILSRQAYFYRDKLPQVSFLSRQKYVCRHKNCQHKTFVMTDICCDKHNFVTTSLLLSRQAATSIIFVAKKNVCRHKTFVTTNICCDKHNFVARKNTCLSRQNFCHNKKLYLWQFSPMTQNYSTPFFFFFFLFFFSFETTFLMDYMLCGAMVFYLYDT